MTLCAREKVELSSFVTGINPSSIQITTGILRNPRKKARTSVDKHAAKMMVQVPIVTNEVSTSGSDMNVDSFETPPVYIDTSDIIPPQKPYPAYFQFANRRRLEMKEKHPGISSVEISKMLSDIWKNETDEFREKYSIEETKQRAEYKIAMEEYHKKIRERALALRASWNAKPVPAGINRPTMTFSFRPRNSSRLPMMAASVKTRVVSWKEAAEMKLSVDNDALVIPNKMLLNVAGILPSARRASLVL